MFGAPFDSMGLCRVWGGRGELWAGGPAGVQGAAVTSDRVSQEVRGRLGSRGLVGFLDASREVWVQWDFWGGWPEPRTEASTLAGRPGGLGAGLLGDSVFLSCWQSPRPRVTVALMVERAGRPDCSLTGPLAAGVTGEEEGMTGRGPCLR